MDGKNEMRRWMEMIFLPLMLLFAVSIATAQMASQNYQILSSAINSGGGQGSSTSYGVQNSTGQAMPTGISQSPSFGCFSGFQSTTLEEFSLPEFQRGDVNGDLAINIVDVLAVINHILGTVPITDPSAFSRADCNDDGIVNILDALGIVNVILGIGECAPGACKTELTAEALEFMKALEPYFPAEEFAKLMALAKPEVQVPAEYTLAQNYPNPFNPVTSIEYTLPEVTNVKIEVYNLLGQVVEVLVDSDQEAGYYHVQWDASGMASGVYFYKLSVNSGQWSATKRMVLMR